MSVVASAHQDSTGICAPSSWSTDVAQARDLVLHAGEALHQGDVAERVGGALGQIASNSARPIFAGLRSLRSTKAFSIDEDEAQRDQQQRRAANSDTSASGSSTATDTKATRCSRKKPSHSPHSVSVPVSITFISRPECVAP